MDHLVKKHGQEEEKFPCTYQGCNLEFTSQQRLKVHVKRNHEKKFR
jgi:hypothetical protein